MHTLKSWLASSVEQSACERCDVHGLRKQILCKSAAVSSVLVWHMQIV